MAAPTQPELFLVGRNEAVSQPTRFDRAIIDTDGSDVNVVLNVSATQAEEVGAYHQRALNALHLATAEGEDLDRLVWDRYRFRRKEDAPSVTTLKLERSSAGAGVVVDTGSPFGTTTGQRFVTVVPAAFAAGSNGPVFVVAVCDTAGEAGNVPADSITVVEAALTDTTITVTNPEPAAGGQERQTDDQLKDAARQFWITARRGTKSAIEFGAKQVPQVALASADEVLDPDSGLPVYRVSLIVADNNGQANAALAGLVDRELEEYRGLGVPVLVVPASAQYVNVVIEGVQFLAGTDTAQALRDAKQLILAYVNNLKPGKDQGTLYPSALLAAIGPKQVPGLLVPKGALVEPAGDLVPTTGTVIRTSLDRISINP